MPIFKLLIFIFCVVLVSCKTNKAGETPLRNDVVVFEPDSKYSSMRIPSLSITKKGTLLAFCEARIGSSSDWADIDLVMRRSTDGGNTWSKVYIIDSMKKAPVGNPTVITDDKGTVHLLYQKDYARAFHITSNNDGITWSQPKEITEVFEKFKPEYDWKVLAPGPGHGIQMHNGRLLSAVWLANSNSLTPRRSHHPSCVATIYSDDYGKTWQRGTIVADNSAEIKDPNESMPVLLSDGSVLLSIRNLSSVKRRAFSVSKTGIDNWSKIWYQEELFDPACMASIVSLQKNKQRALLFINPDSRDIAHHPRENLTAKVSFDDGKTWPLKKVLNPGAAGYNDAVVDNAGNVYCLYETNTEANKGFTYSLVIKKINTDWIFKN